MKHVPKIDRIALVAALVLATGHGAACRRGDSGLAANGKARGPVSFPVEVETVAAETVAYGLAAVGSVEAFETVQVTARVAGVVERVDFVEGDRVQPGKTLIAIEPQRFKLIAAAAEAAHEKARAALADAQAGLERREAAVRKAPGLIPGEEVATWGTRVRTAQAEVAEADAALAQANLNLRDAYVRAPVKGVIETRTVQTGQYVQPGAVLATLVRRDPLLLRFGVPSADAVHLTPGMKVDFQVRGASAAAENPHPGAGGRTDATSFAARVSHVAQAADAKTRMVAVTAQVTTPDHPSLRPGAFAEVTVPIAERAGRASPVIAETAIRPSERGFVVFVVEDDRAVERIITMGLRTADGRVEVTSGVAPGERLVVRGAEALRDGAKVRVETNAVQARPRSAARQP